MPLIRSISNSFQVLAGTVATAGLLGACGLERPIEAQPLVSVVDEWRQMVLAENSTRLIGDPVDVPSAEFEGDFGELEWNGALAAEGTGTLGSNMLVVEMLAGGGTDRWGMAIVGIYRPQLEGLVPGVRTRVDGASGSVIGCTGEALFEWDYDAAARRSTLDVEVDVNDPALAHYDFVAEFEDGTAMRGRFTVELPARTGSAP